MAIVADIRIDLPVPVLLGDNSKAFRNGLKVGLSGE